MALKGLPTQEEIVSFAENDNNFREQLMKLGRATLDREVEVAFKVESRVGENQFYISKLGLGTKSSAHAGKSTSPHDYGENVTIFQLHSHLGRDGTPKAAIFSIGDLFNYIAVLSRNVSRISTAIGISEYNLYDDFEGNLLHQEGIVRPTEEFVGLLLYQPPIDIVRPASIYGYDLAKPNNHYVDMINAIGKINWNNQERIIEELRNSRYVATFLNFDTTGRVVDRI